MQHFYTVYSSLALSRTSDRAQAVAGLQRRIARAFGSAASYGVLWRWPERMLLWRRAADALTRIDYHHHRAAAPPSWSWMAYDGRISFLEIPFAGVEWTGNVHEPPSSMADGCVRADASWLRVDGAELMERAVLDMQGVHFVEDSWRCVLVGKEKEGQEENAAQYVLLIRPILSSPSQPGDLYERVGVATLLASHVSVETSSVVIV